MARKERYLAEQASACVFNGVLCVRRNDDDTPSAVLFSGGIPNLAGAVPGQANNDFFNRVTVSGNDRTRA